MPRRSAVLDHPQRDAADRMLRAGQQSTASIARELGIPIDSLKRYARRLVSDPLQVPAGNAAAPPMTPVETFEAAFGMQPTSYQVALLSDERSTIFLKSRQCGATQAAAALAIATARARSGADAVIISPSLQQSKEVTKRARDGLYTLEEPLVQDSTSTLRLRNGSRVLSLPGNQRAVRGYAPSLVIADEASWILDETYAAIRPLLAASHGRLVCQSTPGAKVGWFYELWQSELGDDWLRLEVKANTVPFIEAAFLERERRELAPEVFAAEYEGIFGGLPGAGFPLFDMSHFDELLED
jgi:hypothetical protein